jgi:hypothetical protein
MRWCSYGSTRDIDHILARFGIQQIHVILGMRTAPGLSQAHIRKLHPLPLTLLEVPWPAEIEIRLFAGG